MRYIVWLARLLVFVLVLMFALNNTEPVDVRFYGAHFISGVPLIVVMLAAFVLGTGFALLLTAGAMLQRGREVKRLKRELDRVRDEVRTPDEKAVPSSHAPLAPL